MLIQFDPEIPSLEIYPKTKLKMFTKKIIGNM